VAAFFVAIALVRGRGLPGEIFAEDLVRSELFCEPDAPQVKEDLEFLVTGTRFEGRLRFNAVPDQKGLNVLFFCGERDSLPARVRAISGNCAYIGEPATIACDANYFDALIESSGLAKELRTVPSLEANRAQARRYLIAWILGHEIGHVVRGHRPSHFAANRIDEIVASSSIDQRFELEADAWFAEQLPRDPARRLSLETLLLDLLYAQVRAKVGSENLFPATGVPLTSSLIVYGEHSTHPEFVIRATRMLSMSFRTQSSAKPFLDQVEALARGMRAANTGPWAK
jgi:hypothetical protein